ncbi:helix-turn-helix transcriptional regulator [Kitasatospora sp. NPDC050463]|uniref:helix-turn-helix domain-containing protein n=1 Tax=Kitasatospora sp. NPDC050463 TaxID=3155786 RepID=UPI003411E8D3
MALRTQISERQKRFGAELRRLREAAGLAVKDAGATIGMGGPQLSHIEAARTGLDPSRLATLLAAYGCTDETYMAILHDLGASDGKGWWTEFKGKVPALALDLAEVEGRAVSLASYDSLYIPGVFQLPGYARAIYESSNRPGAWESEVQVQFRMERQRILTDGGQREFRFVIHEAALRMRFAGDGVMRAQLLHLVDLAELPNVTIQVVPFTAPNHAPLSASFLLCDPGCADLSTVILDAPRHAEHLGDQAEIVAYRRKLQQLSDVALPAVDTTGSLRDLSARSSLGLIQHLLYLLQS